MSNLLVSAVLVLLLAALGCFVVFGIRARRAVRTVRRAFRGNRIVASPDASVTGEFAQAMACGAHLAVQNGEPWNSLADRLGDPQDMRAALREVWGVASHGEWRVMIDWFLADNPRGSNEVAWLALEARRQVHALTGAAPDLDRWREVIGQTVRANNLPETLRAELLAMVDRVTRYELRLRSDGLMPISGMVTSVRAFDIGRAPSLARWGLLSGHCDEREARQAVLLAGRLARSYYASWTDFSAGYVLGRLLHFDNEEFGVYYQTAARAHKLLATDPASPWRTLPWG